MLEENNKEVDKMDTTEILCRYASNDENNVTIGSLIFAFIIYGLLSIVVITVTSVVIYGLFTIIKMILSAIGAIIRTIYYGIEPAYLTIEPNDVFIGLFCLIIISILIHVVNKILTIRIIKCKRI